MAKVGLDGAALEVVERGGGTPVVFVHGSASDHRTWHRQLDAFGERYRAIAYSRRYHWPNEPIAAGGSYALADHTADLAALLGLLDARPAHLVGHSYGGLVCLALAVAAPEAVRSLVLLEPPVVGLFGGVPPRPKALLALALRSPATALGIVKLGAFGLGPAASAFERGDREEAMRRLGTAILGRTRFERLDDERAAQVRDNLIAEELLSPEAMPALDAGPLRTLDLPVLLVGGGESPRVFARLLDHLERILPRTERCEVADASHIVHEDDPAAFDRSVLAFLAAREAEGAGPSATATEPAAQPRTIS